MRSRHVAYGLDLRCSFELPGMPAGTGGGLPTVALKLVSAAELDRTWSGASGRYSWTGGLGDGCTLTIEAGSAGELLFAYGDRARFLLSGDGELLRCAPLQQGLHWQQVLLARVLPDVALARGYEALHASALESDDGVIAIAAPSGTGKTTLSLALMRRGWRLFADDVLVLGSDALSPGSSRSSAGAGGGAQSITACAGAPLMNVAKDVPDELAPPSLGTTLGVLAGERWVAVGDSAQGARPVQAVFLLERGPGLALEAQPLAASPLALAPYMLGLEDDPGRERHRFRLYSDLVESASLLRLTGGPGSTPTQLAELVERSLAEQPVLAVGEAP